MSKNTQYLFAALQTQLPASRQIVLIHMANAANVEGECWTSHRTLASRCGCSVKHVRRAIAELRKAGYLDVLRPAHQHHPARYRLDLERTLRLGTSSAPGVALTPRVDCESPLEPRVDCESPLEPEFRVDCESPLEPRVDCESLRVDCESTKPLKNLLEEEEKDTQTESDTDSRTGEPTTPPDVCVSLEDQNGDTEDQAPPARCLYRDPMTPCLHEVEALSWMSEQEGYRVKRHPSLHPFLHEYSVEDFKLLYGWHLRHTERQWRHLGNVCGQKADHCLHLARCELAEPEEKPVSKGCQHPAREIILERHSDAFLCRACSAPLSDAEATNQGVSREAFTYDSRENLRALRQALGLDLPLAEAGD